MSYGEGMRRFEENRQADIYLGELETTLAAIDVDISQAIQSCKEEVASGRATEPVFVRTALHELRTALRENRSVVSAGRGGYLFEQGENALDFWKI